MSSVECPECRTPNPTGNKFCESCGMHLGSARKSAKPARERQTRRVNKDEEVQIHRDLAKVRGRISTVRALYGVCALATAIDAYVLPLLAGVVPPLWYVAPLTALFLIALGGALFAHLNPLAWTLGLAALYTISAIHASLSGGIAWVQIFITLTLWSAVPTMLKAHSMLREHPDLVGTTKLGRRPRRSGIAEGATRARAADRSRRQTQTNAKTFAIVGGVVVSLLLGVLLLISISGDTGSGSPSREAATPEVRVLSPQQVKYIHAQLPTRIGEFERAWQVTDLGTIQGMFTKEKQIAF